MKYSLVFVASLSRVSECITVLLINY